MNRPRDDGVWSWATWAFLKVLVHRTILLCVLFLEYLRTTRNELVISREKDECLPGPIGCAWALAAERWRLGGPRGAFRGSLSKDVAALEGCRDQDFARLNAPIAFNKPLPLSHHHIHRRSLLGILLPAALEELPYLDSQADLPGVLRHLRSASRQDLEHDLLVLLPRKRDLSGENLNGQHRKGEYVGGFRLQHRYGVTFARRIHDFWGQPSGGPDGFRSRCDSETRAGIDRRQPVLSQASAAIPIDDDVRLWATKSVKP